MKSNTVMAVMMTVGFGTYYGVQGAQRIAESKPITSPLELRIAMQKDADYLLYGMRKSFAAIPGANITIVDPIIDAREKTITFDLAFNDLEPTSFLQRMRAGMEKSIHDQGCPAYLKSVMGLNGVELVYSLKLNDGVRFGEIRVGREICINHSKS